MSQFFPPPRDHQEFELVCLRYFRKVLNESSLQRYGKAGQPQQGIDLYTPSAPEPSIAIQCKLKEFGSKKLTPKEIKDEVLAAEELPFPVRRYIIATTASRDVIAQNTAMEMASRDGRSQKFPIQIVSWDDFCEELSAMPSWERDGILKGNDTDAVARLTLASFNALQSQFYNEPLMEPLTKIGNQLVEINALFDCRNIRNAEYAIARFLNTYKVEMLPAKEKFKLHRLLGRSAFEKGEYAEAATQFKNAYHCEHDSVDGKRCEVFSLLLLNRTIEAHSIAGAMLSDGVADRKLTQLYIDTAMKSPHLLDHYDKIQVYAENDESVNVAMAHKYLELGDNERSLKCAKSAVAISSESPHAHFALAVAHHASGFKQCWGVQKKLLEQSRHHYELSVSLGLAGHYPEIVSASLLNSANANVLLGDVDLAEIQFVDCVKHSFNKSECAQKAINGLVHIRKFASAQSLLPLLTPEIPLRQFYSSVIDLHIGNEQSQELAARELASLGATDWPRSMESLLFAAEWFSLHLDVQDAISRLPEDASQFNAFGLFLAKSWIYYRGRDQENATKMIDMGISQLPDSVHEQELRMMSHILVSQKRNEEAISYLQRYVNTGRLNDDTKLLLEASSRCKRHDIILATVEDLCAADEIDEKLAVREVELLSRYSKQQAFEKVKSRLLLFPQSKMLALYRNYLGAMLEKKSEIELSDELTNFAHGLTPINSNLIVLPFVTLNRHDDALKFLYRNLRLHRNEQDAYGIYMSFVLANRTKTSLLGLHDSVTSQSAVELTYENGEKVIHVFEDENAEPVFYEIDTSSTLGTTLLGKRVSEKVQIGRGGVHATVTRIISKYHFAYTNAFSEVPKRFPDCSFLQVLSRGVDSSTQLADIVKNLTLSKDNADECISLYRHHFVTLHMLSVMLGDPLHDVMENLATRVDCFIRSTITELPDAVRIDVESPRVVLDVTAVVTLFMCDASGYLPKEIILYVPESVKELISRWKFEQLEEAECVSSFASVARNGELQFARFTSEEKRMRLKIVDDMLSWIATRCEIVLTKGVWALDPKMRERVFEFCGLDGLEAMVISSEKYAILWTDDAAVGLVYQQEMSGKHIWTQALFSQLMENQLIAEDIYHKITSQLLTKRFQQLTFSARTIKAAIDLADWNSNDVRLQLCVKNAFDSIGLRSQRLLFALNCIREVFRSGQSPFLQTSFVTIMLNSLGDYNVIDDIRGRLPQLGGMSLDHLLFLQKCCDYWIVNHRFLKIDD